MINLKLTSFKYAAGLVALFALLAFSARALAGTKTKPDTLKAITLWPKDRLYKYPDGKQPIEHETSKPGDSISRIGDITNPTIKIFKPANPNGTAVIVCPGGGYYILAMNLEGEE